MSRDVQWSRFVWRHLDQAAAAELWDELADWVQWARERYDLGDRIPACWFRHPGVVEQLTALMSAHTAAYQQQYTVKGVPVRDWDLMSNWHRVDLWPVVERLSRDLGECAAGGSCTYRPRPADIDPELNEFVATDVADRPETSTTRPTADVDDIEADDGPELTTIDMEDLVKRGDAVVDDPADPESGVHYRDLHWTYDPDSDTYRPDD